MFNKKKLYVSISKKMWLMWILNNIFRPFSVWKKHTRTCILIGGFYGRLKNSENLYLNIHYKHIITCYVILYFHKFA